MGRFNQTLYSYAIPKVKHGLDFNYSKIGIKRNYSRVFPKARIIKFVRNIIFKALKHSRLKKYFCIYILNRIVKIVF